ncbi:MAG: histidine phosphatase family protein [Pseudomonadales bacterium]|nr:histidine phosphatase family protein [Pseudomonadales bacterium]
MKQYPQHRYTPPVGATEIVLVRHGQSRAAIPGQPFPLQPFPQKKGQGDPELSALGRMQALKVAAQLASEPINAINAIYVTSLCRTHESAAPLAAKLGLMPIEEAGLREVHLGEWEGGVLRIKVHENDALYQQMQLEQRWDVIPGAESHDEIQLRVAAALSSMVAQHQGQRIVAFVHGGIIGHILSQVTRSEAFAFNGCDNGSISRIVAAEDTYRLRGYNDTAHLQGLESDSMLS